MKIYTTLSIDKEKVCYRNISDTRKSNIVFLMSDYELEQYCKCYNDIFYFIENFCKINSITGLNNIKLREYQKTIISHYQSNHHSIFLNSRQIGMSTLMALVFLHETTFHSNIRISIYDNKTVSASEFLEKIKVTYRHIPFFLKKGLTEFSSTKISFENGSYVEIGRENNHKEYDIIYFDNFAWFQNASKFFSDKFNLYTLNDPKIVISSAPNGFNFFYSLVQGAERNENTFKLLKNSWWQVPGRTEEWRQKEINCLGSEERFLREYELCFISKK